MLNSLTYSNEKMTVLNGFFLTLKDILAKTKFTVAQATLKAHLSLMLKHLETYVYWDRNMKSFAKDHEPTIMIAFSMLDKQKEGLK